MGLYLAMTFACLFFCHAVKKVVVTFAVLDRIASLYLANLIFFSLSISWNKKKGNCDVCEILIVCDIWIVLSCNSDLFLRTVGLYFPNLSLHLIFFLSQKNKSNCDVILFFTPLLSSYSESLSHSWVPVVLFVCFFCHGIKGGIATFYLAIWV